MMVTAPQRAGHQAAWHPECFRCKNCDELLVDLQADVKYAYRAEFSPGLSAYTNI